MCYSGYRRISIEALLVIYSISFALCLFFIRHHDLPDIRSTELKGTRGDSIFYNYSNSRSQIYELVGDIRIRGNSSTVWMASGREISCWTTKPYARQEAEGIMSSVTEMKIVMDEASLLPTCDERMRIPAVIFSSGGYANHAFHAIADIIIPLYFTSHEFNGSVMFLVSDFESRRVSKYGPILERLSDYDLVDLNDDDRVLCFSRVILGLDSSRPELGGGPKLFTDHTMTDFKRFIRDTYSLKRHTVVDPLESPPRLLLISREASRRVENEGEIRGMCERVGFEVDVREIKGEFSSIARYVNTFDVMVGVHGAGLANMIFLPENAIVVQIVPFALDVLSKFFYEFPTRDMKLGYFNYTVAWDETSLSKEYSSDDEVHTGYRDIVRRSWHEYWTIYMLYQNLTLNVSRLEKTISHAIHTLRNGVSRG